MVKHKKGVVPPHLRKYLFSKGRHRAKGKRRRATKAHRKPATVHTIPSVLAIRKNGTLLRFDGKNFVRKAKPQHFRTMQQAERKGRALLRRFPVLRQYQMMVRSA
jgi:hypothetical protein